MVHSRFTEAQRDEAARRAETKEATREELAAEFGVSPRTITDWVRKKNRSVVTVPASAPGPAPSTAPIGGQAPLSLPARIEGRDEPEQPRPEPTIETVDFNDQAADPDDVQPDSPADRALNAAGLGNGFGNGYLDEGDDEVTDEPIGLSAEGVVAIFERVMSAALLFTESRWGVELPAESHKLSNAERVALTESAGPLIPYLSEQANSPAIAFAIFGLSAVSIVGPRVRELGRARAALFADRGDGLSGSGSHDDDSEGEDDEPVAEEHPPANLQVWMKGRGYLDPTTP